MTPQDIAALRETAEKATPGPWGQGMAGEKMLPEVDNCFHFGMVVLTETGTDDADGGLSTAAYIAAASPDVVLALLSALEDERERGRVLRVAVEALAEGMDERRVVTRVIRRNLTILLAAHVPSPLLDGGALAAPTHDRAVARGSEA